MEDQKYFQSSFSKRELQNRLYERGLPTSQGLPSVNNNAKNLPRKGSGLKFMPRISQQTPTTNGGDSRSALGAQHKTATLLSKQTSNLLAGASKAVLDHESADFPENNPDAFSGHTKAAMFQGIDDVQMVNSDLNFEDEDAQAISRNQRDVQGSKNQLQPLRHSSSNDQRAFFLRLPKPTTESTIRHQNPGSMWAHDIHSQLAKFKDRQESQLLPQVDRGVGKGNSRVDLLKKTASQQTFSHLHPQFSTLNCEPYKRDRISDFGIGQGAQTISQANLRRMPVNQHVTSITGLKTVTPLAPSSQHHKLTVTKPHLSGSQVGGSRALVHSQSEAFMNARNQTKQLRNQLFAPQKDSVQATATIKSSGKESILSHPSSGRGRIVNKLRRQTNDAKLFTLDYRKPGQDSVQVGEVQNTEEILRKHYFIAKATNKTVHTGLDKEDSPQKHVQQKFMVKDGSVSEFGTSTSDRHADNEYAMHEKRLESIEKMQLQAASLMRLNAAWGLEQKKAPINVGTAIPADTADLVKEGVVSDALLERRKKFNHASFSDSTDLDMMITLFQSQPEDNGYFIYLVQGHSNNPYDLIPLIDYKNKGKSLDELAQVQFNKVDRPTLQDSNKFFTLSKKGFTTYINEEPVEYISLNTWLTERNFYRKISSKDFFRNFRTWKIIRMWRRNILHKRREEITQVLTDKLFMLDDTFGPILARHRVSCKEMETLRVIDMKQQGMEVFTLEDFQQKQVDKRAFVTKVIEQKSNDTRNFFKQGISDVLEKLRSKINQQQDEEDATKQQYMQQSEETAPKQIVNANPTLEALGFNHNLKYGPRSKLRKVCSRFLRFSYLLDFLATEALTNIYLNSIKETIRYLDYLASMPVEYEFRSSKEGYESEAPPLTNARVVSTPAPISTTPASTSRTTQNLLMAQPFFQVRGLLFEDHIPKEHFYKIYIDHYAPPPLGESLLEDFNPMVHLELREDMMEEEPLKFDPYDEQAHDDSNVLKLETQMVRNLHKVWLSIEPSGLKFSAFINDCLLDGMECLKVFERWSRHPELDKYEAVLETWDDRVCMEWEQPESLYLNCDEWLIENRLYSEHSIHISKHIKSAFEKVEVFLEGYNDFLLKFWQNKMCKDFAILKDDNLENPNEVIGALIQRFQSQKKYFENYLPEQRDVGMIRIDTIAIRQKLLPSPKKNLDYLKELLPRILKERIENKKDWLKKYIAIIKQPPGTVEAYVHQIQNLDYIDAHFQQQKDYIELNVGIFQMCQSYEIVGKEAKQRHFIDEGNSLIATLNNEVAMARENADRMKEQMKEQITLEVPKLHKKTSEFIQELEKPTYLAINSNMKVQLQQIERNDIVCAELLKGKSDIQTYQKTLEMDEITPFENIDEAKQNHVYRARLWKALSEWTILIKQWETDKFENIEVDEISRIAESYTKTVIQCERNLPANSSAVKELKKLVFDFKETMPIVQALGNKNLTQVHWDEIKSILNIHDFPLEDRQFQLGELIKFKVASKQEEVLHISTTATQEFNLQKQIDEINKIWVEQEFDVIRHKDRDAFKITKVDTIQNILDESLSAVSDIQGSRYVKRLQKQVQELQEKLILISETVEQWKECQRNWLYLENIFASPDIRKQRAKDYQDFDLVNRGWNKLMKKVNQKRSVRVNCTVKNYNEFLKFNESMDRIQKHLEAYLEEKRSEFPRFYFISNEELLQLLAHQQDVKEVEKHLNKCFDNVKSLILQEEQTPPDLLGMVSSEGERVEFAKVVKIRNNGVEGWLGLIEQEMFNTMQKRVKDALAELNKGEVKHVDWVLRHCGQAVAVASQISWTESTEYALHELEIELLAMDNHYRVCQDVLQGLVTLIRSSDLGQIHRKILVALITAEVHNRDIVEELLAQEVESTHDFEWQKQLKYYQEEEQALVTVRQVNAVQAYGYEYMGATSRLVITPLTDRCWLTITGAQHIHLGAQPAGPAGTGKTETTKDLAKALGVLCIVFNCSEQVEYRIMGRIFAGLVQSGAWTCLDEFNRINVEVLSVIAQYLIDIRQAKLQGKTHFDFYEKVGIPLKVNCGVFVTMNPGYAGRTELPDNLKVLFRPVSMMIPSYRLIAEVMLFAEGFAGGKKLSTKMVQLYKLASEQLSQQDHYDFGMRAVKSVLVMAGNLKRANQDLDEDIVLIRAMRDSNVPKFISADLPLFQALIQDLFPGASIPEANFAELEEQIDYSIGKMLLEVVPSFKLKVVQLFDIFNVRFGVMIVGPAGGGKTTCYRVLQDAMIKLHKLNEKDERFEDVKIKVFNPKSISMGELYGEENQDTKEWTDGLASKIIRKFAQDQSEKRAWCVFDGPVDALWIENMNTVLDDNMTLCLANGERIKLRNQMRMLFEVQDLAVASPATVSRCGMVYMTPSELGWRPYKDSWMERHIRGKGKVKGDQIPVLLLEEDAQHELNELFELNVDDAFDKLSALTEHEQLPCVPIQIITCLCNFLETFIRKPSSIPQREKKDFWMKSLNAAFGFSFIWAFGGHYKVSGQRFVDNLMRDFFGKCHIPLDDTVFEYQLEPTMKQRFQHFKESLPEFDYPETPTKFFQLVVPTVDSYRFCYLTQLLAGINKPVFITGNTGTGKSMIVQKYMVDYREEQSLTPIVLNFSAQTDSMSTQVNIEGKLEKKRKKSMGAKGNSKTLIFVDDVNMPAVEIFGAQPPIELLRQLLDQRGFYDRTQQFFKEIEKFTMVCAAAPPAGGRSSLTPRFMRHFHIFNVPDPTEETLTLIFESILGGFLQVNHFPDSVKKQCPVAVSATIDLYQQITRNLLPIPAKFHYTFNLRDIAKVFQGILMSNPVSVQDADTFARLWLHESCRVFADRLCTEEDREFFMDLICELIGGRFKVRACKQEDFFTRGKEIIYSSILKLDDEQKHYEPIKNRKKLLSTLEDRLTDYNFNASSKMDLVFFDDAVTHICSISRILMQPRGNAMLIGVSGCGKQSLTRLAASMLEHVCFQVKLSKNFKPADFRDTLRERMLGAGCDFQPTTFILTDTQIMHESFLEDVNNILNTGEITNLYAKEDIERMDESLSKLLSQKKIPQTKDNVYTEFIEQLRNQFHIILCMSPVGDQLRIRARKFPSLVNCCTLDWFDTWPEQALLSVAHQFLARLPPREVPDPIKRSLNQLFPKVHKSVEEASGKFYDELRRKTYVTPKSYLDSIQLYLQALANTREKHEKDVERLQNGVTKLESTNSQIESLQEKLTEMRPILEKQNQNAQMQAEQIKFNRHTATQKELEAEHEAATVRMEALKIEAIRNDAEYQLSQAQPTLDAANRAVDELKKDDITELKAFKSPNEMTVLSLKCTLLYLNIAKPDWPTAQKLMTDPEFLKRIQRYNKEKIDPIILKRVKPYVTNKEVFDVNAIANSSKAAGGLARWCVALYKYSETLKIVKPKQEKVKEMEDKYKAAMDEVTTKQNEVLRIKQNLQEMQNQLNATMASIEKLSRDKEQCEQRLINAGKLTELLADEGQRWMETVESLKESSEYFIGNVFIAAASLSYLGPFTGAYRTKLVKHWRALCTKQKIQISKKYSLVDTMGDKVEIRGWNIAGLPSDQVSVDNGILAFKTSRWPLMIDPQTQANSWLKKMYKNLAAEEATSKKNFASRSSMAASDSFDRPTFVVIKMNDDKGAQKPGEKKSQSSQKKIEFAILTGQTVLLEDCGEEIDPGLDSVLTKSIYSEEGVNKINFGDKAIVYDPNFRLLMTTKLSNPHFLPETCIKLTIINFTVTSRGLEDQLLVDVLNCQDPEVEKRRDELVLGISKSRNELFALQNKILTELADSNADTILDNTVLIETLEVCKIQSINVKEFLKESELVEVTINQTRDMYRQVSERGSILYFTIVELAAIDPMYQNSLQYIKKLFNEAINAVEKHPDHQTNLDLLQDAITKQLYEKICIGLFEDHKVIYAFLICTAIQRKAQKIREEHWNLLLRGAGIFNKAEQPGKPDSLSWLSDAAWDMAYCLQQVPGYATKVQLENFERKELAKLQEMKLKKKQSQQSQMSPKSQATENDGIPAVPDQITSPQASNMSSHLKVDRPMSAASSQMSGSAGSRPISPGRPMSSGSKQSSSAHFEMKLNPFTDFCNFIMQFAEEFKKYSQEEGRGKDSYFKILPQKYEERLTSFEKLLFVKMFKPEKIMFAITKYLEAEIGKEYAVSPISTLQGLFSAADCSTPIIFVLSQGVDPTNQLIQFAERKGVYDKLHYKSLGQGQEAIAENMIQTGRQEGNWVLLQNCHLFKSWMPQLEAICNEIQESQEDTHPSFRLILTSMPADYFPPSVLQGGLKMTTEPPQGIKSNLQRSYINTVTQETYDELDVDMRTTGIHSGVNSSRAGATTDHFNVAKDSLSYANETSYSQSKKQAWRNLLFGLCFFHALIQERKKFGPLGWNIRYEFSEADLTTSITMMKNFLQENDETPWDAMKFMTGEINYGGRVTDDIDRKLLMNILSIYQTEELLTMDDYIFSKSGQYFVPKHQNVKEIQKFIESLPDNDDPEVFGMHQNANISYLRQESQKILDAVLLVQPRESANKTGNTPEQQLLELVNELKDQVPELIDPLNFAKEIMKKNSLGLLHCFTTVLQQEVERYNLLLNVINTSLVLLEKAVNGLELMSPTLDAMFSALLLNRVPPNWSDKAYPSLKPLASWMLDLDERVKFMRRWAQKGHPKCFWLSGLFFPHGFMTGVLQTYARKHTKPVDLLKFGFDVRAETDASDIKKGPLEGVYIYGLFIEGAKWSTQQQVLVEAEPGEMNAQMPIIHFVPKVIKSEEPKQGQDDMVVKRHIDEEDEYEIYKCPVYKTSVRAGVLSTTGQSTNFILSVDLACGIPEVSSFMNSQNRSGLQYEEDSTYIIQEGSSEHWTLRGTAMLTMLDN